MHDALTGTMLGGGELDLLHALAADGRFPARIGVAVADQARAAYEANGTVPGAGDDLSCTCRAGRSCPTARTRAAARATRARPYLGTDTCGHPNYTDDELVEAIARAHGAGWQVMIHANGDAAVEQVVSAYERALAGTDPAAHDRRHRIEHCSLPSDDELARMAAIGISPSFLMNHVHFWGRAFHDEILEQAEKAGRLDPVASARRHGLRPTLHSDYTVTPVDPLLSVQTTVPAARPGCTTGERCSTRPSATPSSWPSAPSPSTPPGRPTATTCSAASRWASDRGRCPCRVGVGGPPMR